MSGTKRTGHSIFLKVNTEEKSALCMHICLELNPIVFSSDYSKLNMYKVATMALFYSYYLQLKDLSHLHWLPETVQGASINFKSCIYLGTSIPKGPSTQLP